MNPPDDPAPVPDPEVDAALRTARPQLSGVFERALGQRLVAEDPGWKTRPRRLWGPSLALILVGAALLIVGALISVGGI